jgi:RNA methyltransferase, TrmH family
MLSKNTIKFIQSLYQKKNREAQNAFVVEGYKMVNELLHSKFVIKSLYALENWKPNYDVDNSLITIISTDELQKISSIQTPQQVIAIAALPDINSINVLDIYNKWTLVLDNIQDPGNLGTIIRLADWYGIENIVCSENTVDCYNSKVLMATMGSFTRVNCYYSNLVTFFKQVKSPIYGALLQGENLYHLKSQSGCIVIGNEGNGISAEVLPYITKPITIPKKGKAESLNAAMAASIIVSQFCK